MPALFSGNKLRKMRKSERKMSKCNVEFVETIFGLMFETFWMAPYDPRRGDPVLACFERRARYASVLLGKTDFASATGAQLYEARKAVAELEESVQRIAETGLFRRADCAEALERVRRIREVLAERCGVTVK